MSKVKAKVKERRKRKIKRQQRLPGIRREPATLVVHPAIRAELIKMARIERVSVSYMLASLIIEHWNFDESK